MMIKPINLAHRLPLVSRFSRDSKGIAAVEFAFILPLMLTLIFGIVDASTGIAIDRKTMLVARTLSDLVSQGATVSDTDIKNFFGMGSAIMSPYSVTPATLTQTVSAISIDGAKKAKVAWSFVGKATGNSVTVTTGYTTGSAITTIPPALLVANTQLIWSEVTYTFTPIAGYVWKAKMPLSHFEYTRPRQSPCVLYKATSCS